MCLYLASLDGLQIWRGESFCHWLHKPRFVPQSQAVCHMLLHHKAYTIIHSLFYRLMKAQALGDTASLEFMRGRRILEVNPDHPIIKDLNVGPFNAMLLVLSEFVYGFGLSFDYFYTFVQAACKNAPDSSDAKRAVDLLYDTALISSGFSVSTI